MVVAAPRRTEWRPATPSSNRRRVSPMWPPQPPTAPTCRTRTAVNSSSDKTLSNRSSRSRLPTPATLSNRHPSRVPACSRRLGMPRRRLANSKPATGRLVAKPIARPTQQRRTRRRRVPAPRRRGPRRKAVRRRMERSSSRRNTTATAPSLRGMRPTSTTGQETSSGNHHHHQPHDLCCCGP